MGHERSFLPAEEVAGERNPAERGSESRACFSAVARQKSAQRSGAPLTRDRARRSSTRRPPVAGRKASARTPTIG